MYREHHNDLADYFEVRESEAALSKGFLCQMGVPKQNVEIMRSGTSTREADYILEECIKKDWNKIGIISDLFRREELTPFSEINSGKMELRSLYWS